MLDRAVHDAVVGEPERRHPELGRALGQDVIPSPCARSCRRRRAASTRCGRAGGRPLAALTGHHGNRGQMPRGRRAHRFAHLAESDHVAMIWLLRHGDAEDGAGETTPRGELTEKGERQARAAGRRPGGARRRARRLPRPARRCAPATPPSSPASRSASRPRRPRRLRGGDFDPLELAAGPRRGAARRPRARLLARDPARHRGPGEAEEGRARRDRRICPGRAASTGPGAGLGG